MKRTQLKKILCILVSIIVIFSFTSCENNKKVLRIGTANKSGMYYKYASKLKELVNKQENKFELKVKETAGSDANLRLLKKGFLDIAIIQNDILFGQSDSIDEKKIQAIANLYDEYVHIVVNKKSNIKKIEDLKGKTISIGEKDSATYKDAIQILNATGIGINSIDAKELSIDKACAKIKSGKIDALFFVGGTPIEKINDLLDSENAQLINIDDRIIDVLTSLYPKFSKSEIKGNTYNKQTQPISTIAVRAVLAVNKNVDDNKVKSILNIIQNKKKGFQKYSNASTTSIGYAMEGLDKYLHSGAKIYYKGVNKNKE